MLKLQGLSFRPAWWSSIAAAVTLAAAIALGNWQVRRAGEKLALQQRLDDRSRGAELQISPRITAAGDIEYSRVAARGEFLPQFTVLLDNRVYQGRVGYFVFTPLRIDGGNTCVLVNRGWVAAGPTRDVLPEFPTPSGMLQVEGIAVPPTRRFFELRSAVTAGKVWENILLDRYAAATGLNLQPFVVQQQNAGGDRLIRVQERPDTGVNMHRGYAFQWYALGALVIVLYLTLNLKRRHEIKA